MIHSNEKSIPKGWQRITAYCYMDKKGKPHLLTKSKYSPNTTPYTRKRSLQYARTHRKISFQTTQIWKEKNVERVEQNRKKSNKLYGECIKEVKKYRARNFRVELKNKRDGDISSNCAEYHHSKCMRKSRSCSCWCHKGRGNTR